ESALAALLASPLMERCISLDLSSLRLGLRGVRRVASSEAVGVLLRLDLGSTGPGGARGAAALGGAPPPSGLVALGVRGNRLGDEGLCALASSEAFPALHLLDVSDSGPGPAGVIALAESTQFQRLRVLHLGGNRLDQASAAALAGSTAFPALEQLTLSHG